MASVSHSRNMFERKMRFSKLVDLRHFVWAKKDRRRLKGKTTQDHMEREREGF